jgi:L-malate glycosyltransferase
MKILNLIWGFSLGAGIDKCYLTYDSLSKFDKSVDVLSVCINLTYTKSDLGLLKERGVTFIDIKSQIDFSWVGKLAGCIKENRPGVIFTHGFNGAIMMLFLKYLTGLNIPVVCTYHGLYHAPISKKKMLEPIYNGLSRWVYKYVANKVICVENKSRDFLISKGIPKNKIVTVYNGLQRISKSTKINLKDFNICKDKLLIITASRISEVKGLPFLLKAIADIKDKTSIPFQYIMLGTGPDLENLKQQVVKLKIEKHVSFLGYQTNIEGWLNVVDIFALPSLSECHSIALLEAMRAGTAIIATDVGGNSESVRDKKEGILIPSKNVEQLSKGLLKLIESKELRLTYASAAKERFQNNFTEDRMKENLIKALKL